MLKKRTLHKRKTNIRNRRMSLSKKKRKTLVLKQILKEENNIF